MSKEHLVQWEIDIQADSKVLAAKKAHEIMLDEYSEAVCFNVSEHGDLKDKKFIDLMKEEYKFEPVGSLLGCRTFKEFEKEYDGYILYADSELSTVKKELKDLGREDAKVYYLHGWYVGVNNRLFDNTELNKSKKVKGHNGWVVAWINKDEEQVYAEYNTKEYMLEHLELIINNAYNKDHVFVFPPEISIDPEYYLRKDV